MRGTLGHHSDSVHSGIQWAGASGTICRRVLLNPNGPLPIAKRETNIGGLTLSNFKT